MKTIITRIAKEQVVEIWTWRLSNPKCLSLNPFQKWSSHRSPLLPISAVSITSGDILNMKYFWHSRILIRNSDVLSSLCPDYNIPEPKSLTHTLGFSSRSMIHTPGRIMAVSTACKSTAIHARIQKNCLFHIDKMLKLWAMFSVV